MDRNSWKEEWRKESVGHDVKSIGTSIEVLGGILAVAVILGPIISVINLGYANDVFVFIVVMASLLFGAIIGFLFWAVAVMVKCIGEIAENTLVTEELLTKLCKIEAAKIAKSEDQ